MRFTLNDAELKGLSLVPVDDLVDLAVTLDYVPDSEIERAALLSNLVPRLLDLARSEGLPFSKYDLDDLDELDAPHRAALARAMGWPGDSKGMLKAGQKVYKTYLKTKPKSPVAMMLPLLLKPLARHAFEADPR